MIATNKSKTSLQVTIIVPETVYLEIRKIADSSHQTMTAAFRSAIQKGLGKGN